MALSFITISGNVTDPKGIPYAGGTIVPVLTVGGSPILPDGSPYVPAIGPFAIDNAGNFSFQLAANNQIRPAGSTWSFVVASAQGSVPIAFGKQSISFTVPPLSLNVSTNITPQISAVVQDLTFSAGGGGGGGEGTVTSVSSGSIPNIGFNVTVANPTTTPAFSFSKQNTNPRTFFGNSQSAIASAGVSYFSLAATSDVQFDSTISSATSAGLNVGSLHFGATRVPLGTTPPASGQVLGFDGTNVVGVPQPILPSLPGQGVASAGVGLTGTALVALSGQVSIPAQTFPANSVTRVNIALAGALANDVAIMSQRTQSPITGIAGWSTGSLSVIWGMNAGQINAFVCNPTSSGIVAAALLFNYAIIRVSS